VRLFRRLPPFWTALFRRKPVEQDIDEELRAHIENRADDLRKSGLAPEEAHRRARIEFGGMENYKENVRQALGFRFFDEARQDLRYALRTMRKNPGVAIVAVISLAIGIGANTAIFSILNALLLRSLPVHDPPSLVIVQRWNGTGRGSCSFSDYTAFQAGLRGELLRDVAATSLPGAAIVSPPGREGVKAVKEDVSANYFTVLGVTLAGGQNFGADEEKVGAARVAIVSEQFWKTGLNADPDIVGKVLVINEQPVRVIGIAPASYSGMEVGTAVDLWTNITANKREYLTRRGFNFLQVFGRLQAGVTPTRAAAAAQAIFDRPEHGNPIKPTYGPATRFTVERGDTGFSGLRQTYELPLRIIMGVVALVLLIACVNVANLMLARTAARRREIATRLSLGAGAARLFRQFLTESLLLAFAGGLLGVWLAIWGDRVLLGMLPPGRVPLVLDVHIDSTVLLFTLGVSLGAALLFGLVPAWRIRGTDVVSGLKLIPGADSGRTRGALRPGKALCVVQIAISVLLVFGSGLFVRTLVKLRNVDAGFRPEHVVTFGVDMPRSYKDFQVQALERRIVERLGEIPGVAATSISWPGPFNAGKWDGEFSVPGKPAGRKGQQVVNQMQVGPRFFSVMKTALVSGREFEERDADAVQRVVIVNEAFARAWFPSENPIGRTIVTSFGGKEAAAEVIGVVRNVLHYGLRKPAEPAIYHPFSSAPWSPSFLLRTREGAAFATPDIRRAILSLDTQARIAEIRTLDDRVNDYLNRERLLASISVAFGIIALLLAAVGLYGVMAYGVTRRSREIGLRMALGAQRAQVLRLVLRDAAFIAIAGIIVGVPAALAASRTATALIFGIGAADVLSLAAAATILAAVAVLATWIPARRAMHVDPITVLRYE
jgi:macrolide transport system ATP-binding/permease protein